MTDCVSFDVRDGIAILTVDRPPVNAIDSDVRAGIVEGLTQAGSRSDVRAVVLACAGRTFMSGADLSELGSTIKQPDYHAMLAAIEDSAKPVVAALFGTALGGGMEAAMACHYRVATRSGRVGMPEISLGIVPGAGGTQRLPRLIGAIPALKLMIGGAPISADEAKSLGLVDAVVPGDAAEGAIAFAKALAGGAVRRTSERTVDTAGFDEAGIQAVLAGAARMLKGRTTQFELVRLIKAAASLPFSAGMALETEASAESLRSPESRALVHVFFAERDTARIPGLPGGIVPQTVTKAAVVGAGTMGGGIAMSLADAGIATALIEARQENLDRGLTVIRANYEATVKRGRLTAEALEQRMSLITGSLDMGAAADVDVVIEAVFEDMDLKKSVLGQLDKVLPPHALLASNTSSLSLTELASATGRPDRVVGLHFFSPANVMRLLEIVRGGTTSPQTLVDALAMARTLRKTPVVAGDGFGFIGNRMMLDGMYREAELMLLEGAAPERIDAVAENFGFAMGPNRVNDMAGVDVGTKVRIELLKRERRAQPYFAVSEALTSLGRLGQKTGKGVYRYEPGDRHAYPDPEVTALIARLAVEHGVQPRRNTDEEIEERLILPLINVGAQILDEAIAYRAGDIDVVWTSGYGFPRWRGGPMFYGDELGLKTVVARMEHYHRLLGDYWKPAPLLRRLAAEGRSFADWDQTHSRQA